MCWCALARTALFGMRGLRSLKRALREEGFDSTGVGAARLFGGEDVAQAVDFEEAGGAIFQADQAEVATVPQQCPPQ